MPIEPKTAACPDEKAWAEDRMHVVSANDATGFAPVVLDGAQDEFLDEIVDIPSYFPDNIASAARMPSTAAETMPPA